MPQALSVAAAGKLPSVWPPDGLESVSACPVCSSAERQVIARGLRDRVFRCAPGEWTMYACNDCGTGYLDPRPNVSTIGLAYAKYFTHASATNAEQRPPSLWRRYRRAQRNAYLNAQYGYHLSPATSRPPRWVSTERRQRWDKLVGFVPYAGPSGRLLDVGCSNGGFLMQMREVGWNVCGVEPDSKAAAHAAAAGLDVRVGLIEEAALPAAHFDAITLNHVIEHLHRPIDTLHECLRVLKPGGLISISTPNLQSLGHRLFGGDWFGLEPPRHLVVFTPRSLRFALESCGFEPEPSIRLRVISKGILKRSMHLRNGSDPIRETPRLPVMMRLRLAWWCWCADRQTKVRPDLTEELVLLARRPEAPRP